jgi:hypothetical protein
MEIVDYISYYNSIYNTIRLHSSQGYVSPPEI